MLSANSGFTNIVIRMKTIAVIRKETVATKASKNTSF